MTEPTQIERPPFPVAALKTALGRYRDVAALSREVCAEVRAAVDACRLAGHSSADLADLDVPTELLARHREVAA